MHIKFLALIFICLASLGVTTAGFIKTEYVSFDKFSLFLKSYIHLYDSYHCVCSGKFEWTQICCEKNQGLLRNNQCSANANAPFTNCCRELGVIGVCSDPLSSWR
jgi:hypothetical protein